MDKGSISVVEYESLIRDSERLEIVRDYVKKSEFVSESDLRIILGIEAKKECVKNELV